MQVCVYDHFWGCESQRKDIFFSVMETQFGTPSVISQMIGFFFKYSITCIMILNILDCIHTTHLYHTHCLLLYLKNGK